jgi:hypothetical protein
MDRKDVQDLYNAGCIVYDTCTTWGRLGGQFKEKYDTLRFYANFSGYVSIHSLVYPGYAYIQFKSKFMTWFDIHVATPVLTFLFGNLLFWWQKQVYSYAYNKAIKKYPRLAYEILVCADYPEYIKGYKDYVEVKEL